ncbi:MAG TPA: hypothetical protein VMR33_18335 [Candidatus Baltobacteraceae bacterium]|jgi:hypothetical protein|nr:hypothetical protein [Candidatus Baltobacteraceae bacterium]
MIRTIGQRVTHFAQESKAKTTLKLLASTGFGGYIGGNTAKKKFMNNHQGF